MTTVSTIEHSSLVSQFESAVVVLWKNYGAYGRWDHVMTALHALVIVIGIIDPQLWAEARLLAEVACIHALAAC